jgi:PPM family protein phosphatase
MSATLPLAYRLLAATALHRGDRDYQQDQVEILRHGRQKDCLLAVLSDGMGGKSGGRKAADQVVMTARHLMIKLTAITAEEEPHSTMAAFLLGPGMTATVGHAGDSRVYHFRGAAMQTRTSDHSYVQQLVDEGKLTEEQANSHPKGNLLTGCLGTQSEPPVAIKLLDPLMPGDTLLACSDGLWHYFTPRELGLIVNSLPPREAAELLIQRARQRAQNQGDNVSLAMVRVESIG